MILEMMGNLEEMNVNFGISSLVKLLLIFFG